MCAHSQQPPPSPPHTPSPPDARHDAKRHARGDASTRSDRAQGRAQAGNAIRNDACLLHVNHTPKGEETSRQVCGGQGLQEARTHVRSLPVWVSIRTGPCVIRWLRVRGCVSSGETVELSSAVVGAFELPTKKKSPQRGSKTGFRNCGFLSSVAQTSFKIHKFHGPEHKKG